MRCVYSTHLLSVRVRFFLTLCTCKGTFYRFYVFKITKILNLFLDVPSVTSTIHFVFPVNGCGSSILFRTRLSDSVDQHYFLCCL